MTLTGLEADITRLLGMESPAELCYPKVPTYTGMWSQSGGNTRDQGGSDDNNNIGIWDGNLNLEVQ